MVTKLDLFYVKGLLEKVARGSDAKKAEAAKRILNDGMLFYEYTRVFVEKHGNKKSETVKVSA